ncbi:MAG: RNase adapter protein RapZ [Desulfovibrio sp.]
MDTPSSVSASENAHSPFPVIFVTGLSGAGKSTVLNVFEDMHFFTMDGLPAAVIANMTEVLNKDTLGEFKGLVIGVNLLNSGAVAIFNQALGDLAERGILPGVLFIEADNTVLMRRYATTRRPHPLESEGLGLEQALEVERARLDLLREKADLVIDTSGYSIHDLRRTIQKKWAAIHERVHSLKVHLISFGFKYGMPAEADMVFDLRFLPNPFFIPELKAMSGLDKPIADFLFTAEPGQSFVAKLKEFLLYLLPLFESEGRYRTTIAIGCTGGRHRSVAVTQAVAETLKKHDFPITVEHRHLELG